MLDREGSTSLQKVIIQLLRSQHSRYTLGHRTKLQFLLCIKIDSLFYVTIFDAKCANRFGVVQVGEGGIYEVDE